MIIWGKTENSICIICTCTVFLFNEYNLREIFLCKGHDDVFQLTVLYSQQFDFYNYERQRKTNHTVNGSTVGNILTFCLKTNLLIIIKKVADYISVKHLIN